MVYLLFFASGIASLLYEVCWVRAFGNQLGNTVHSASLVTAVFMCGLGAGSWLAGNWADRRLTRSGSGRALLSAYGACELAASAMGLGLVWLLPLLGGVSGSYTRGIEGWYELAFGAQVARHAIAIALVAPPTVVMGATLTLLVRGVVTSNANIADAGSRIGFLYGANTAGAAVGALACDTLLVPALGITRTQLVAVGLQIGVGLTALALSRQKREEQKAEQADTAGDTPSRSKRIVVAACATLALSGFAALGMEIAWFRFLAASLGGFRFVFSLVLAVVLAGIWGGAFVGAKLARRYRRPLELFAGSQALVVVSSLALLASHRLGAGAPYGVALRSTIYVVAVPSFAMGFAFPLVNAHVQDVLAVVGRRVGYMYLANTVGSVVGSIGAGFVVLPVFGAQVGFAVFAVCAMAATVPLLVTAEDGRLKKIFGGATLVSIATIAIWLALPEDWVTRRFWRDLPPPAQVLSFKEGPNETVAVVAVAHPPGRMLMTNGHPMSSTSLASQRYMRAFAHLPLLLSDRRERALVICFGVGSTLHATSLHPLSRIDLADLSRNVLERAPFFRQNHHDVLADPRVSVFVQDGRQHLRAQPEETYDLVTLEPPPIGFAGVSALYSREFYELARSRLAPGGWLTQWLPIYDVPPDVALSMVRAFVDVFPASALLSGSGAELILIGTKRAELVLDIDRVEERLRAQPHVAADLHLVRLDTLTEIAGTFIADADHLRRATSASVPVTDDRPSMEYTFARATKAPRILFERTGDRDALRRFCPKCFLGQEIDPRVAMLPRYVETLARVYSGAAFLENRQRPFPIDQEGLRDVIAGDDYLRALVGR